MLPLGIVGMSQIAQIASYLHRAIENATKPILKLVYCFVSYIAQWFDYDFHLILCLESSPKQRQLFEILSHIEYFFSHDIILQSPKEEVFSIWIGEWKTVWHN